MNIITVSLSKTFSDTRVMKYIEFYLDKSYFVTCFGVDSYENNFLKKKNNFNYIKFNNKFNQVNKFSISAVMIAIFLLALSITSLIGLEIIHLNLNIFIIFILIFSLCFFFIFCLHFIIKIFNLLNRVVFYTNQIKFFLNKEKKKFELIHIHDLWTILMGFYIKKKIPNAKLIVDLHELYSELPRQNFFHKKLSQIFLQFLKLNKKKVFKFITINKHIKNYYIKNYKFIPIITINNSCPIESPKNDFKITIDKNLLKLKKEKKKILMYHGGISLNRGIIEFCKFFTECEIKDWVFYIMGSGKGAEQIKELIDQNTKNNIFLTNPVKLYELQHYSSFADMGLINYKNNCLNHNYCTPNKLWEYSRASLPMLLSNCTSFIELNNKYNFGKIVDDKNYEGLLKIFSDLTDKELEKLSANSSKFYMKENWEVEKNKIDSELLDL